MLNRMTQALNALIFGSFAYLATSLPPVGDAAEQRSAQPTAVVRTISTRPANPVQTISEEASGIRAAGERGNPVRTLTERPTTESPRATSSPAAIAAAAPADSPAARDGNAPRLFSPSSPLLPFAAAGGQTSPIKPSGVEPRAADPIVPPLIRKRPADTVASVDNRKQKPKSTKAKPDAATPSPGIPAAVAAAPKASIDLSGRSALGAPPPAQDVKCAAGLKYDAKSRKCAKAPPASAKTAPVRPNPAPPAAQR